MFFQKALKGIPSLTAAEANRLFEEGIICNWWRDVQLISPAAILEKLTERNLDWHLNHYNDPDPLSGGRRFSEVTPFISLTAGAVERDVFARRNIVFDPFITALRFATKEFAVDGCIVYCYVFTLGRQAVKLEAFSEEVRELNIYTGYLPFHPEGEITANIAIKAPQIEKWEFFQASAARSALEAGKVPTPVETRENPHYARPEDYSNVRDVL